MASPPSALRSSNPEALIAVMGSTGSGKSSFINLVSGSQLAVGRSLKSCTREIQTSESFLLDKWRIRLVDTPGFDDTFRSDADILRLIASFLQESYEKTERLRGVIYVHRITDVRMGGISTRNFTMFRKLCGMDSLKNVVIVTTGWDLIDEEDGVLREKELSSENIFFKTALDAGASMIRHYRHSDSAKSILRCILSRNPTVLTIQKQLVDQKLPLAATDAGLELDRVFTMELEKNETELLKLRKEIDDLDVVDEQARLELETAYAELHNSLHGIRAQVKTLRKPLPRNLLRRMFKQIKSKLRALAAQTPKAPKALDDPSLDNRMLKGLNSK